MGWREEKLPGSFRGVPFEVVRDSQPAGQRTQVHEYPMRDEPYVESLGKRTKEIKVSAFVAGDDCLQQRDRLLAAIEEPGAGELIHPWLGSLMVSVTGCDYSHVRGEMGVVHFELTFVKGVADPSYPVASVSAAAVLNGAADDVQASAIDRFVEALDSVDLSQLRAVAVLGPINRVISVVQDVYGSVDASLDAAQGVIDAVLASPGAFADQIFSVIDAGRAVFDGFYARAQGVVSLFGLGDRLEGIVRLADVALPVGRTNRMVVGSVRALMQDAVIADVVRGVGILPTKRANSVHTGAIAVAGVRAHSIEASMGSVDRVMTGVLGGARLDAPIADDVLALRDSLGDALWGVAEAAGAEHYQTIAAARAASTRHLVAVARQGVVLARYRNPAVLPALVLAYRRYGDVGPVADIVARNRVQHPGFVPAVELLVPRV